MNTNNAAKNVYLSPLRLPSLLGVITGILMLVAMAAPSAQAHLLTYFNFNNGDFVTQSLPSDPPSEQLTHLTYTSGSYPGGNIVVDATGGTTLNAVGADPAGGMLDLMGNVGGQGTDQYCFFLGGLTTTGKTDVTLSFAIMSQGNTGQFTTLDLLYSTTGVGGAYTLFATDATLQTYATYTLLSFNATALTGGAVDGISGSNLFFEFCLTGSSNNANGNNTFIDNIQVNAVNVPEPATVFTGAFAALGLCWSQRRWLVRSLRFRPA